MAFLDRLLGRFPRNRPGPAGPQVQPVLPFSGEFLFEECDRHARPQSELLASFRQFLDLVQPEDFNQGGGDINR
ncbi:MAG TPA: hypothetical protein VGD39_09710 [Nocardioides sp.]